ncbi:MAG TPA: alpha-glucosidase [Anaerolineales bacterium]|nr:alpha-glucosidase [Anaerolineales bacterium]
MSVLKWWQSAVFYQIYPRSFADGNGDGIGDFVGMLDKLDYLRDLGVDALWLSPHFPSPQFDVGYDVSDYVGVEPAYGTLDDFKRFLDGAHARGMRVVLDLVLNHTSDQHGWFLESRRSVGDPKRDWYIWRPGRPEGGPPNNWQSVFGGSAWELDPLTGQYYYHFFFKEQPDLNWRNPEVRQAMWDAARFWLDLGVDGYRLDAVGTIFESEELPDHPVKQDLSALRRAISPFAGGHVEEREAALKTYRSMFQYQHDLPEVHDVMRELRRVIDEYDDRVLIGETEDIAFYGDGNDELHLNFNFGLINVNELTPEWIRRNQSERLAALPAGAWPCNTLGNHDRGRLLSVFGRRDPVQDAGLARVWLALMLTLKGTPFLYNGEEIGMTDLLLTDLADFRDNVGVWLANQITAEGHFDAAEVTRLAALNSRDRCRTPMPWSNAPNAGFSPVGVRTWLPVNPNYAQGVNVADQESDPASVLSFYKRMLAFRRRSPALIAGDYQSVLEGDAQVLAYVRRVPGEAEACLVVLNTSGEARSLAIEGVRGPVTCLFSTHRAEGQQDGLQALSIAPFEVLVSALPA